MPSTQKKLTLDAIQGMNRHERRALGKLNGIKFVGTNQPYINHEKRKKRGIEK